jgi:HSP20 family protein
MTYVKFNQHPAAKAFGGLVEEIFNNNGFKQFVKDDFQTSDFYGAYPPANIYEGKDGYTVELLVPGYAKEDIKINVENKSLVISTEKTDKAPETKEEGTKQTRKEFSIRPSFKRSFNINEQVDTEKIQAKYENGVLKVILPKKETIQAAAKAIVVE